MRKMGVTFLVVLIAFLCLAAVPSLAADPAKSSKLPGMMAWSAFGVGSRGYVQAAAISNALIKVYGTKVRIIPSGTSVGRLMPMKTGAADYGLLADEVYFAANAIYEFASAKLGTSGFEGPAGPPRADRVRCYGQKRNQNRKGL